MPRELRLLEARKIRLNGAARDAITRMLKRGDELEDTDPEQHVIQAVTNSAQLAAVECSTSLGEPIPSAQAASSTR